MRIYIKTAPYQSNSYVQHLIEHLVCKRDATPQAFFEQDFPIRAESHLKYASFYTNVVEKSKLLHQLFAPLSAENITKEKRLIQQECGGRQWNKTLLVNRLGKELYGADFGRAKPSSKASNAVVLDQHKKFYYMDNCWITDNDFKILQRPQGIQKKAKFSQKLSFQDYAYTVRGDAYTVRVFDETGPQTYALCYFLDWFSYVWSQYAHNHLGVAYDFPTLEFFEYYDKLALIFLREDLEFFQKEIDPDFFQQAMKVFLETDEYLQEIALITEIRSGEQVLLTDLKAFLTSFTLAQVQEHFKIQPLSANL